MFFPLPRALNAMDTIASQGGRIDAGGYRWPPTFSNWVKIVSWQFGNLLFLSVFRVLNFRSRFEALNDVFWASTSGKYHHDTLIYSSNPRIDLSNELLCPPNGDCMPKLCPREVDTPNYPNGVHKTVGFSSSEVSVLDFVYCKKAFRASL
jgi:hypothetical protein